LTLNWEQDGNGNFIMPPFTHIRGPGVGEEIEVCDPEFRLLIEDEVMDAMAICGWDELSDEALRNFEGLVDESALIIQGCAEYCDCHYRPCNICPTPNADSYIEFRAQNDSNGETWGAFFALIGPLYKSLKILQNNFEDLVDQSAAPAMFLDKIRYWTLDDWKDWLMGDA